MTSILPQSCSLGHGKWSTSAFRAPARSMPLGKACLVTIRRPTASQCTRKGLTALSPFLPATVTGADGDHRSGMLGDFQTLGCLQSCPNDALSPSPSAFTHEQRQPAVKPTKSTLCCCQQIPLGKVFMQPLATMLNPTP